MEEINDFATILIERHKHATFKPAQEVHVNIWAAWFERNSPQ